MFIAIDLMNEDFPRISRFQGMGDAFEKFSEVRSERLPVVDDLDSCRLIGSISKTDIMMYLSGKQNKGARRLTFGGARLLRFLTKLLALMKPNSCARPILRPSRGPAVLLVSRLSPS